jgi:hypothetical protein
MAYRVRVFEARLTVQASILSARRLRRVIDDVQDTARIYASHGTYSKTKALSTSIQSVGPILTGLGVTGKVFSNLPYAASVEGGAKVHTIFPKGMPHIFRFGSRKPRQLKFVWRGRTVYTPHVPMAASTIGRSHPGQSGKHYLRRAAIRAALKWNMKFIPY